MSEIRWDPDAYLRYRDERLRPGFELIDRIAASVPGSLAEGPLVDLGCGTGEHAVRLAQLWPGRDVFGLDRSVHMLEAARAHLARVEFALGDIEQFTPATPPALIFSNAALQWLSGHEALLARLYGFLARGGMIALQMPSNLKSRAHALARDICLERGWQQAAASMFRVNNVLEAGVYYNALKALGAQGIDIWETTYQHALDQGGVTGWLSGTALRPVLSLLEAEDQAEFMRDFDRRVRLAYPPQADGVTLYPQARIFVLARKA